MMMLLSSGAAGKLDRAPRSEVEAMGRRWWVGLASVVVVLVLAAGLFLWLRGPAPEPRYLQVTTGMKWDQAEKIMGREPYSMYLVDGVLEKYYPDVDGRVKIAIEGED